MMGQHTRSESLFYYFRIEDQVPEDHWLRLIDGHVSFDFVHDKLRESYSDTGRPSMDPAVPLRILLLGYWYGITSERRLVEELRMHLAWRWFTGLDFDREIPHHSTFSKNRHGRFRSRICFRSCFERIVDQCMAARDMIEGYGERYGRRPQSLAAANTYGNGELLHWLVERGITPYIRVKESPMPKAGDTGSRSLLICRKKTPTSVRKVSH